MVGHPQGAITELQALPQTEAFASPIETVRARIEPDGQRRTVFFAGKGGVGKTVASCITAVWLARQGYKTLLLTTDPAAHIGDVLDCPVGDEVTAVHGPAEFMGREN